MRKVLVALFFSFLIVAVSQAAPGGAVRCGKLVDVRAGRLLENAPVLENVEFVLKAGAVARNDFAAK